MGIKKSQVKYHGKMDFVVRGKWCQLLDESFLYKKLARDPLYVDRKLFLLEVNPIADFYHLQSGATISNVPRK